MREGLKMMGVTPAALLLSWYITYAAILLVMTFFLTLALKLTLMRLTSFLLLNLFFWLFTMSYIVTPPPTTMQLPIILHHQLP